jgi:Bacterial Ig-like domain (group 2)
VDLDFVVRQRTALVNQVRGLLHGWGLPPTGYFTRGGSSVQLSGKRSIPGSMWALLRMMQVVYERLSQVIREVEMVLRQYAKQNERIPKIEASGERLQPNAQALQRSFSRVTHRRGFGTAVAILSALMFCLAVLSMLTSISVTPKNQNISTAQTEQYTVTSTYSDVNTNRTTNQVAWSSGSTSVATINSSGSGTTVGAGTTTISATRSDKEGSASLTAFNPVEGEVFCGGKNATATLPNCDPASPTSNTVFVTTLPDISAYTVVQVNSGGNLQTAINHASCSPNGTIISLQAGATFNSGFGSGTLGAGPYQLPNKTCAAGQWIIIQSSAITSLPASGTRVSPSDAVNMPKIQSVGFGIPALVVVQRANHYRFIGIEFNAPAKTDTTALISLNPYFNGSGGASDHIIFDRCYIHGNNELTHEYRRGIYASGVQFFAALDSYINLFHSNSAGSSADTQAISMDSANSCCFKIVNNYLSASGENIISGGSPNGGNGQPHDFEIRHNHFYKPDNLWRNSTPATITKNLFELKNAVRGIFDGNVLEKNWMQAQIGDCFVITSSAGDSGPGTQITDWTFTHNWCRHVSNGFQIGNNGGGRGPKRILIQNNIFQDVNNTTWGDGTTGNFVFNSDLEDMSITFDHNTAFEIGSKGAVNFDCNAIQQFSIGHWVFTNNIVNHSANGVFDTGCGFSEGSSTINHYTPARAIPGVSAGGSVWSTNVIINKTSLASSYPRGSFLWATPDSTAVGFTDNTNCVGGTFSASACQLLSTSPYHNAGTDGKDIGADINSITTATAGVVQVHD